MDFLKSIDSTIWAAIIGGICAIIGGFISNKKKSKVEPSPRRPIIKLGSPVQSPHQIPPPDSDFIGRENELQELLLQELLDKVNKSGVHISGIYGMGGIGKTQLALKLAENLKPRYPDAQIYLDLKGVTEGEQIPLKSNEALAHIIRAFEPDIPLPDTVDQLRTIFLSILNNKKTILLMDNALDENQIQPLIPPKDSILLVTSRKKFSLPGIHLVSLDTLSEEESIQLLLNISNRIGDHAKSMAKLCGYLPKALKVAGMAIAEHPDLSPEEYIEELKKNDALEPVDRSLAASCKWLVEAERNYFYRLSVFPGSFDSRAAGAVWELEEGEAKKTLSNLLNISLVEWSQESKRYGIHPLGSAYARKHLREQDYYAIQKLHAEHFLKILTEANSLYEEGGANMLAGLQLFDLEWENIETGQAWAAKYYETDIAAAKLCNHYPNAGSFILLLRQHPRERIQWRETALAASQKLKTHDFEGFHLGQLGIAYGQLGENQEASDYYAKALQISRELGDRRGEGNTLGNLGNTYSNLGDTQKASDYYQQALQISREIGDKVGEGNTLGNLGNTYSNFGDYQKAIEYYEQALKTSREIGDKWGESMELFNMSLAVDELSDRARAITFAEEALKIREVIGDPGTEIVRKQLEEWMKESG